MGSDGRLRGWGGLGSRDGLGCRDRLQCRSGLRCGGGGAFQDGQAFPVVGDGIVELLQLNEAQVAECARGPNEGHGYESQDQLEGG